MAKKRSDKVTVELLREVRIFNPYQLAVAAKIAYIDHSPNDSSFGGRAARVQVVWPNRQTDPEGHWMDNGHKTFDLFRPGTAAERKAAAVADAQAWAEEQWGPAPGGWKKFRIYTDTWWPADILDATIAELLGES